MLQEAFISHLFYFVSCAAGGETRTSCNITVYSIMHDELIISLQIKRAKDRSLCFVFRHRGTMHEAVLQVPCRRKWQQILIFRAASRADVSTHTEIAEHWTATIADGIETYSWSRRCRLRRRGQAADAWRQCCRSAPPDAVPTSCSQQTYQQRR